MASSALRRLFLICALASYAQTSSSTYIVTVTTSTTLYVSPLRAPGTPLSSPSSTNTSTPNASSPLSLVLYASPAITALPLTPNNVDAQSITTTTAVGSTSSLYICMTSPTTMWCTMTMSLCSPVSGTMLCSPVPMITMTLPDNTVAASLGKSSACLEQNSWSLTSVNRAINEHVSRRRGRHVHDDERLPYFGWRHECIRHQQFVEQYGERDGGRRSGTGRAYCALYRSLSPEWSSKGRHWRWVGDLDDLGSDDWHCWDCDLMGLGM